MAVFPELPLTGYAIDDLLRQDALLDAVRRGLSILIEASTDLLPVIIVGAPLRHQARLFNTAVRSIAARCFIGIPELMSLAD